MSAGFRAGQSNDGYLQINGTDILTVSSGVLGVKNTGAQSEMRLYCESNNAHYASLKSPPHSDFIGNVTFTLPGTAGSSGQVLQTDGSGNLSWANNSGGGGGGVSDKISEGNTEAEVVDTGSDGHFKVTTEGLERLLVTSTGLVGVNCTPLSQFQVKTATNANIALTADGSEAAIEAFNDAGSASVPLRIRGSEIKLKIDGTQRARLYYSSSSAILSLGDESNSAGHLRLEAKASENQIHGRSNHPITFLINTTERLRVGPNGQIGLGGANYGTSGQVLTSGGASGAVSWTTISGGGGSYGNSDVDNHLNSGGASSGQILSWNGSDYAWVADQGGSGGGGISDLVDDTTPQLGGNLDINSKNITGTGNITITGTLTSDGVTVGDSSGSSDKINLGTGNDLQIYHNGTNSYIDNGTGSLYIRGANGNHVRIQSPSGEESIVAAANGSVDLYYDNSKKFETTNTGVSISGTAQLVTGSTNVLSLASDASENSVITQLGSGLLTIKSTNNNGMTIHADHASGQIYLRNGTGVGVVNRLATTSSGVTVTGTLTATTFSGSGANLTNLPAANITGTLPAISGANLTNLPSDTPADTDVQVTYDLSANGSSAYRFTGPGYSGADDNPDLYLVRGQRYRFINATGGHPFRIQSNTSGTAYTDGVSGSQTGTQDFNVQYNAPERLYYQCTSHSAMIGNIYIVGASDWRMTDVATSATPEIFTNLNVGIGNNNPNRKLVISQANSTAYSGTDFDQDYHVLKLNNTTDSKTVGMQFLVGSNGEAAITATETSDGATDLAFGTRGGGNRAERLRIDSDGRLGLNQTSINSSRMMEITQPSSYNSGLRINSAGSAGNGAYVEFFVGIANYKIGGDHGSNNLKFRKDGAEVLRLTSDGHLSLVGDNQKLLIGANDDIQIYHDASHSYIEEAGTGALKLKGNDIRIENTSSRNVFKAVGTACELFFDNGSSSSKRFETTNLGVKVTNNLYLGGSTNGGFSYNSIADTLEVLTTNGGTHSEWTSNAYVPNTNAGKTLGYHNKRWDTLYVNKVAFGGSTNTDQHSLDDYEEGTWSPTVVGGSGSVGRAYYIKVGRKVTIFINVGLSNRNSSAFTVTLPFQGITSGYTGTSQGVEAHGSCMLYNASMVSSTYNVCVYCWNNHASLYASRNGMAWRQLLGNEVGSSIQFTAHYVSVS